MAVVACPVYYKQEHRTALYIAADKAGFELIEMVGYPEAAYIAYESHNRNMAANDYCLVLNLAVMHTSVSVIDRELKL